MSLNNCCCDILLKKLITKGIFKREEPFSAIILLPKARQHFAQNLQLVRTLTCLRDNLVRLVYIGRQRLTRVFLIVGRNTTFEFPIEDRRVVWQIHPRSTILRKSNLTKPHYISENK